MPTLTVVVAGEQSNSYATLAEAATYFDERLALPTPWVASGDNAVRALIMAARVLETAFQPSRVFVPATNGQPAYYRARRTWTGLPATAAQCLAWPRIGMYDRNGNVIASGVIPNALKEAQAELAGQLAMGDRTLDSDAIVQGITSLKAGSVSLSFRDGVLPQVIPDAVLNLMPPSWFTDEEITYPTTALFEVL